MPIALPILGAVIGAGATIYASNKAAKISKDATAQENAQQQQVVNATLPYQGAGTNALTQISDPSKVLGNFQVSPDYNFRLQQGEDAVTTNKAVNDLLRSGSALKAVTGYASNLASNEFGNWWSRQQGLANTGLTATGVQGGAINQQNQNTGTNATNQGGAAIATGNAIGQLGGSVDTLLAKYSNDNAGSTTSYAPDTIPAVSKHYGYA